MDRYCDGWSETSEGAPGLCRPELVKLIFNAILVFLSLFIYVCAQRMRKELVRFSYHNIQYTCLIGNFLLTCFEALSWHVANGAKPFIIMNTVFQLLGALALFFVYAGGERTATVQSLIILAIYYLTMFGADVYQARTMIAMPCSAGECSTVSCNDVSVLRRDIRIILACLKCVLLAVLVIVSIISMLVGNSNWMVVADRDTTNKHWTSALPSRMTFSWMRGLLIKGYRTPLEMSDLGKPAVSDRCGPLAEEFSKLWEEACAKSDDPSLIIVCLKLFKRTYLTSVVVRLIGDTLAFVSPFCIGAIISYVATVQSPKLGACVVEKDKQLPIEDFLKNGYVVCMLIFCAGTGQSLLSNQYSMFVNFWRAAHIKALLQLTLFKKSLRLASWSSNDKSLTHGKILNVMSTDVNQYHFMFYFVNFLVVSPIQILFCVGLLIHLIGWSALLGVLLLFISFPINGFIAKKMGSFQSKIMQVKDRRLKLTNEMLLGMKSIKMYSWEPIFEKALTAARLTEMKIIRTQLIYRGCFIFIANIVPVMMACSIFIVYNYTSPMYFDPITNTTQHTKLTSKLAIEVLSLLNLLRLPFILIPFAVGSFVTGKACAKRIIKFLKAPEINEKPEVTVSTNSTYVMSIKGATLAWDIIPEALSILKDITVDIPRGKLTIVVGEVGSGKSGLVSALLSEMHLKSGSVQYNVPPEKISYASQKPWILNSTVKENITFGQPLDEKRYQTVCAACCLDIDFEQLPGGDQCEIGERGINLSGGQRQRISVARALYAPSEVVILDDPLSALDAHVGNKLFEQGIKEYLSDRTVVLITHHLQYLKDADLVIELEGGRINYKGEHTAYEEQSLFYKEFLKNLAKKQEEEEEVKPGKKEKDAVEEQKKGALMSTEEREKGAVSLKVYFIWARACGLTILSIALFVLFVSQCNRIIVDFWITVWTEDKLLWNDLQYIGMYIGIAVSSSVLVFIGTTMLVFAAVNGSQNLFVAMLKRIIIATPRFFDITPLGRIISRFSNDLNSIDIQLLENVNSAWNLFNRVVLVLVVQIIASYWFGIAIIPIFFLYFIIQRIYLTTSREIQRLDSICKSPIMALFSECLGGLSTIRAYQRVKSFSQRMEKYVDDGTNTFLLVNMAARWVGCRLDFVGIITTTLSGLVCVIAASQKTSDGEYLISSDQAGLALAFALTLPGELNWMLRNISFMELYMNAVERINHYATQVPVESDDGTDIPKESWPAHGAIEFLNYSGAYDTALENVLKDVSLDIPAGKRIGICGRTGSGKSSLTIALFRMLCCKGGTIKIDGQDIMKIPLRLLRSNLTIIPQDPLLFAGTLRYNLDPSMGIKDGLIWSALERVMMSKAIKSLQKGLDEEVTEAGDNFSVGQRQLLCLARAFLRNSKIIIMDEATASIDMETDEQIQQVLRTEFAGRTMLVIAHRISSIVDSDLILVMDNGKVAEYDTPHILSNRPDSLFASLLTSNVL